MAWYTDLAEWSTQRLGALLGHGASVRTDDFEVKAATADGVIRLLREIRNMPPRDAMRVFIEPRTISPPETAAGSVSGLSMTDGAERFENAL